MANVSLTEGWWKSASIDVKHEKTRAKVQVATGLDLKGPGKALPAALNAADKASRGFGKAPSAETASILSDMLDNLEDCARDAIKEWKLRSSREKLGMEQAKYQSAVDLLSRDLLGEIESSRITLQKQAGKLKESDDDDDSGDILGNADEFQAYLQKIAKKLKGATFGFAIALQDNDPANIRLVFHRSKAGKSLLSEVRKLKPKKFTFGRAGTEALASEYGVELDGKTLALMVEGKVFPQLAKRLKILFRIMKVAQFKKVVLIDASGNILDQADDDDQDETLGDFGPDDNIDEAVSEIAPTPAKVIMAQIDRLKSRARALGAEDRLSAIDDIANSLGDGSDKTKVGDALQKFTDMVAELDLIAKVKGGDAPDSEPSPLNKARAELIRKLEPYADWAAALPPTDDSTRLIAAIARIRQTIEAADEVQTLKAAVQDLAKLKGVQPAVEKKIAAERVRRLDTLVDKINGIDDPRLKSDLLKDAGTVRVALTGDLSDPEKRGDADRIFDRLETEFIAAQIKQFVTADVEPKPLDKARVTAAMDQVPFLKKQLVAPDGKAVLNHFGVPVKDQIEDQIAAFDTHLMTKFDDSTGNAIRMLVALKGASGQVAGRENIHMQQVFTKKLLQYHGDDLILALCKIAGDETAPSSAEVVSSMRLLDVIAGEDPLTPHLEKEIKTGARAPDLDESTKIRETDLAERIRSMATKSGKSPTEMLEILKAVHQIEVGTLTRDVVTNAALGSTDAADKGKHKGFEIVNLRGEVGPDYFDSLLETDTTGIPMWDTEGLKYKQVTKDKLDKLKAHLAHHDEDVQTTPVEKQAPRKKVRFQLNEEIPEEELREQKKAYGSVLDELKALAAKSGGDSLRGALAKPEGSDYVPPVGLRETDLTPEGQGQFIEPLTEKQYSLLRKVIRDELLRVEDAEKTAVDQARKTVESFIETKFGLAGDAAAKAFDKCKAFLESVPLTITFKAEKMFGKDGNPMFGKDYIAEQMISKDIRDDADLFDTDNSDSGSTRVSKPNPNSPRGEDYGRWRREKDDRETGLDQFAPDETAVFGGVNLNMPRTLGHDHGEYGSEHMVLKSNMRDYSTFCFTTAGKERRDMSMILQDIVEHPDLGDNYMQLIMNNALGGKKTINWPDLDLEFHCYGPVDMTKDVSQINMTHAAHRNTDIRNEALDKQERVRKFCEMNNLPDPQEWKPLDPDEKIDIVFKGAKPELPPEVLSGIHDAFELSTYSEARDAFFSYVPELGQDSKKPDPRVAELLKAMEMSAVNFLKSHKSHPEINGFKAQIKEDVVRARAEAKSVKKISSSKKDDIQTHQKLALGILRQTAIAVGDKTLADWVGALAQAQGRIEQGKSKDDAKRAGVLTARAAKHAGNVYVKHGVRPPDAISNLTAKYTG